MPVMVTSTPSRPLLGMKEVSAGCKITVKSSVLVAVPPLVVTLILPVFAPEGTFAVICVEETTVNVETVLINFTLLAPVKFAPVIVTCASTMPLLGLKEAIVGGGTVKSSVLVAVPPAVITLTLPVEAPFGTVAVICVAESSVNVAAIPLNFTLLVAVKFVPVIVTCVPCRPLVGVKEVSVGGKNTIKSSVLVAVPAPVVTLIFPVVAPEGTFAVICVEETTVNVEAAVPLNFTPVAPVKLLPVIVTSVPTTPLPGVNEAIAGGGTVKSSVLVAVPPAVVTVILPVEAPFGTLAVICVAESSVNVEAIPLNFTLLAPVKFVPVTVTCMPGRPLFGVNDAIVGGGGITVKLVALSTLPAALLTLILPVVAPTGTVARICVSDVTVKVVAGAPLNFTLLVPVK